MNEEKTCKDKVNEHFNSRMEDLKILWACYVQDDCQECDGMGENEDGQECEICEGSGTMPENHPDFGSLFDYGLGFDYVAPNTFGDQPEGYFRYQLSWGGPSDEFRIYADQQGEYNWSIYRVEYWFLDWYDGAKLNLSGDDLEFIENLISSFFMEVGSFDSEYNKAMDW